MNRHFNRRAIRRAATLALLLAAGMLAAPALAQHGDGHGRGHGHGDAHRGGSHHQWHGDRGRGYVHGGPGWGGGHWAHGHHGGQLGWWWVVGPSWYYYPAPVYPYPAAPWVPSEVLVPVQYWYFCQPLRGYYPNVSACPIPWTVVPATPGAIAPVPLSQVP